MSPTTNVKVKTLAKVASPVFEPLQPSLVAVSKWQFRVCRPSARRTSQSYR